MQTHSLPSGPGEGSPDPVRIEVFRHLFTALAEEMGAALRSAAFSPNIKERRDYSCALFSPGGVTVAQGDHMPVHLGAMPMSVAAALEALPEMEAGDVAILNDPFEGGSHLPDITLTAPVYQDDGRLLGYVAARAHHSDVGGMSPGSMPLAREIFQEGLRIPPVLLHRRGERVSEVWRLLLANVRTPEEREGDLEAQMGALHTGARRLRDMARRKGPEAVLGAMEELVAYGERLVREGLRRVPDGSWSAEDQMEDDGMGNGPLPIRVTLTVAGDRVRLDFTGTAPQTEGGINAPAAVTASAARYVLRCVVEEILGTTLPAGGGALECLELILPDGSLVNARSPAAVAAGNVELSQRITDVLLTAFARALPEWMPALSQGTMNNTAVGGVDPRSGTAFTYYETVGGGMGAGPGGPGLTGVHTHMSNTLNTPVEALEHAYPFLVTRYEIRKGSGGQGLHKGGDGLRRDLAFSGPAQVTLLTERRSVGPSGAAGGEPGAAGENRLIRDGDERSLPAKASFRVQAGDILSIRSPGGGGWGEAGRERGEDA
jgi:N-methylhydantoinase B